MYKFELNDYTETEEGFRSRYKSEYCEIVERTQRCHHDLCEETQCANECHFLIVDGVEGVVDGYPVVHGLDCDVEVVSGGGDDIENYTVETFCREHATPCNQCENQENMQWEQDYHRSVEQERRASAEEARGKRTTEAFWRGLSGREFEKNCALLFGDLGFVAELTPHSNDGGIDVNLYKERKRGGVQCKAWCKPCGVKELREFWTSVIVEHMEFAIFVALSGFTPKAKDLLRKLQETEHERARIEGWDVRNLVARSVEISRMPCGKDRAAPDYRPA